MKKFFTVLFHPFFILCKNIFVLVETTTNREVIDDIVKALPLSKINDDFKNSLIKIELLKNHLNFHLKYMKIVEKNLVKQEDTVYMNCLIISIFFILEVNKQIVLPCVCFVPYVSTSRVKS